MQTTNDLHRIETSLLESMINAYSADDGRLLSADELKADKKTIALFQIELKSRKKPGLDIIIG